LDKKILVSIVIPNEKDLEVMKECIKVLQSFDIGYEVIIISAHRSPDQMIEYAKNVRSRGIQVIIATAMGAAHLPGMIAAFTTLPVIAVPLKSPFLDGLDSVVSILQMPYGVPVATVSVNGAGNAAILVTQILSLQNENIRMQIDKLKIQLDIEVEEQQNRIRLDNNNEIS
jgi:5-(carboxyamino)imidazole ribonucleotide mutase